MNLVLNPFLDRALATLPALQRAVAKTADDIARDAEGIGRTVAPSYQTMVEETETGARITAATEQIGAAGWIEWGTPELPALAPLRRAVEISGARLEPGAASR